MKKEKWTIIEVPNPLYKEAKRKSESFIPTPKSIKVTNLKPQKPLSEVIKDRERRHRLWLGEKEDKEIWVVLEKQQENGAG